MNSTRTSIPRLNLTDLTETRFALVKILEDPPIIPPFCHGHGSAARRADTHDVSDQACL